jgi:hypothetical protein
MDLLRRTTTAAPTTAIAPSSQGTGWSLPPKGFWLDLGTVLAGVRRDGAATALVGVEGAALPPLAPIAGPLVPAARGAVQRCRGGVGGRVRGGS